MYRILPKFSISVSHTHMHIQSTFWKILSEPSSEQFFQEIHKKFEEAQKEIKNSPTGLLIMEDHGSTNMMVVQDTGGKNGDFLQVLCVLWLSESSVVNRMKFYWIFLYIV